MAQQINEMTGKKGNQPSRNKDAVPPTDNEKPATASPFPGWWTPALGTHCCWGGCGGYPGGGGAPAGG